ncbi:MAG TPA: response regulator [Gemmataceae bacterium]|nr:response regulator [Gemmataceae bacterium]
MTATVPTVRTISVLIVEDNRDAAESLGRFLRLGCGYRVRLAYDGEQGLRSALAEPPDAIVCDINLPKKDGFGVARDLVESLPVKPLLIAVTAFSGDYPLAQAEAAGFDHYLVKPADPFAIEAFIEDARSQGS